MEMYMKCDTCGSVFSSQENKHHIYGDGSDPYFGRCPHCHGIGRFKASPSPMRGGKEEERIG